MLGFAFEAVVVRQVLFEAIVLTMGFYVGRAGKRPIIKEPYLTFASKITYVSLLLIFFKYFYKWDETITLVGLYRGEKRCQLKQL
jgi:hypothetical protein